MKRQSRTDIDAELLWFFQDAAASLGLRGLPIEPQVGGKADNPGPGAEQLKAVCRERVIRAAVAELDERHKCTLAICYEQRGWTENEVQEACRRAFFVMWPHRNRPCKKDSASEADSPCGQCAHYRQMATILGIERERGIRSGKSSTKQLTPDEIKAAQSRLAAARDAYANIRERHGSERREEDRVAKAAKGETRAGILASLRAMAAPATDDVRRVTDAVRELLGALLGKREGCRDDVDG